MNSVEDTAPTPPDLPSHEDVEQMRAALRAGRLEAVARLIGEDPDDLARLGQH